MPKEENQRVQGKSLVQEQVNALITNQNL